MTRSLFSSSWYRVAALKPRLRSHVDIHRHHYRGELWYVLQDHSSGKYHRFTPVAHLLIGLMDGRRSVDEIWNIARSRLGEDVPTQDEMIRLLAQLHAADAMQCNVAPDTAELLKRFEKQQHQKLRQNLRSPLFMRFALVDPERFLVRLLPFVRYLFGWLGAMVWICVVGVAIFMAAMHWPELTENITDRVLAPSNLVLIWLTYPFVKVLHELGHALATRVWGGEVHEMGIMLLVLTPIPYLDASSASAFREKRRRVMVGAIGMAIELFIAAMALFIWINAEPGAVRSLAYNVMLIAGVSTVLFNGNPLLRYDAYYILSDLIEIPNLGSRGMQYMGYVFQKHIFGIDDVEPPPSTSGERTWFVAYTVAAFIYRIFIYVAIILFIAGKFLVIGVLLACWAMVSMFVLPAARGIKFIFSSPKVGRKRMRALMLCSGAIAAVAALVLVVPMPLNTMAEGVIWVPEQFFVRAGAEGFVDEVVATPGAQVGLGDLLIRCSDPLLPARIRVLESRLHELKAVYDTQMPLDRVQAEITLEEIGHTTGRLAREKERAGELNIYSPASGKFIVPTAEDLPGLFVRRGDLLGYVVEESQMTAMAIVSQSEIDLVRQRTLGVSVRLAEALPEIIPATVRREVPAATDKLPSPVLARQGGGEIAIDPRDTHGTKAIQRVFLFDLELPARSSLYTVGGRVYVRFDHGYEPVVYRWYRGVRELFLRRFSA